MGERLRIAIRATAVAVIAAIVLAGTANALEIKEEWKENPKVLWDELKQTWDEDIDTYTCEILGWAYRTDNYIKNFTEGADEDGNTIETDWTYRIYQIKFRKPDWILFRYNYSAHEKNTDSDNLIDKAVANVLKYTGGTTFNYGYKGDEVAYIKFPTITWGQLKKYPIPFTDKLMMKGLLTLTRSDIFVRPLDEIRDPRGYSVDNLIIGMTMDRFSPSFDNLDDPATKVMIEASPRFGRDDYNYDEETGWMTIKPEALTKEPEVIKLTFIDNDLERCKGINKYEAFVDPETMMFVGLHEYEYNKMVGATQFFNIKLNVDLPEQLWEDYFKGRNINTEM